MRKIFFFDLDGSMLDTAKGEYALPPKIRQAKMPERLFQRLDGYRIF